MGECNREVKERCEELGLNIEEPGGREGRGGERSVQSRIVQ